MKAVLFDVGGVLRDSRIMADISYRKAFAALDMKYAFSPDDTWHLRGLEKFNRRDAALRALLCLTRSKADLGKILEQKSAEKDIEEIVRQNTKAGDDALLMSMYEVSSQWFYGEHDGKKHMDIIAGAKKVLETLSKKYALGAVSNSRRKLNVDWFRDNGILGLFGTIVGAEDMKEKKPAPEGILTACKALGVNPSEAAYVGDSASDIAAAKRAGCKAIAVLWGMGTKSMLMREGPDAFAEKIGELPGILEKLKI